MGEKDYDPQMHTVEHLLNGAITKLIGCKRAFSTHIEKKKSKIDFISTRGLNETEILLLEHTVNEQIRSAVEVTDEYLPINIARELFDLSRLPAEVVDDVRIVKIGDYDSCPCIGSHLSNTSEVEGTLKIISSDYDELKQVLRVRFKLLKNSSIEALTLK